MKVGTSADSDTVEDSIVDVTEHNIVVIDTVAFYLAKAVILICTTQWYNRNKIGYTD